MKKRVFLIGFVSVLAVISLSFIGDDAVAQTTISCAEGDEYLCYTGEGPTGGTVEVRKGPGQVIITIPKKEIIQN